MAASPDSTMQSLCNRMLVNSGNSYNLYQRLCDRGYLTPVMFKNYAVYTTRGSVTEPARYIDWLLPPRKLSPIDLAGHR